VHSRLCLSCGLCCNGVLFRDVKLQPEDNPKLLTRLGLSLEKSRFHQPCSALDGRCCTIYSDRPAYCRKFECWLLKRANAGTIHPDAALKITRSARARVERITRLLRSLGDEGESFPLTVRFRRITRKLEKVALSESQAHGFAELTQEMHSLNVLLSKEFLP
jgi:Fe-S-cluster containining protein